MRGCALVLLLAGCDKLFGLLPIDSPVDARVQDGRTEDAALDDSFEIDSAVAADARADAALDAFVDPGCPASYALVGTRRYRWVQTTQPWTTAQADCVDDRISQTKHTHLVVLGDDLERGNLWPGATGSAGGNLWLGLTDRISDTTWQWVTAEPIDDYPPPNGGPWADSEPNNGDCALLLASGGNSLDAVDCSLGYQYVCECDDYPNQPTRY